VLEQASVVFRELLRDAPEAIDYLKSRSLTGITARDFGLGFAPEAWDTMMDRLGRLSNENDLLRAGLLTENDRGRRYDRFRNRIMFPIRDTRGRVIGFGGRVLGAGEPKYLNSPETDVFKKGQELYGLYEARQALRQIDEFYVVEGYMDVIALAQAGICNAVATLGTASGTVHFEKLYRFAPRVTCCFDGDNAGRAAAWKALASALPALKDGCQLRFMFLPDGEDPDSLVNTEGKEGFLRRAANGVSALDYLFDTLAKGLDLGMPDDQARLAHLAKPLIETVPEGVLKGLLLERLGQHAGRAAVRSVSGSAAGVPARPQAPALPARSAASRAGTDTPRTRRLITQLLKHPEFGRQLSTADIAALDGIDGLFVEILAFVRADELAGAADIMGYWAGQPEGALLLELASSQPLIPPTLAAFQEDVQALAQTRIRDERASRLAQLRDADRSGSLSPDQLKAFLAKKLGQHAGE